MLMSIVKHWSASLAQLVLTVSVEVCASTTGINYPLDLKVASLMHIIKGTDTTVNISTKRKVVTAQSKFFFLVKK